MELSNQEMELFLLFPDLGSKKFLFKRYPIFTQDSKTGNRLIETGNGFISPLPPQNKKLLLKNDIPSLPKTPKPVLEIGNGII